MARKNVEDATIRFEESLELNREIGDLNSTASTLHQLGVAEKEKENPGPAVNHFIQALQLRQLSEDRRGEAMTFAQLGQTAAESFGSQENGLRLLCLSKQICEEVGHIHEEQIEKVTRKIASDFNIDESKLDNLTVESIQDYRRDRGWSVIQEAFPDVDLPDVVPPPDDSE